VAKSTATEVGLTQALREGLAAVPAARAKGNPSALQQLRDWVAAQYPHLKSRLETPTFNTTLAGLRQRPAEETTTAPATLPDPAAEPTLSDLLKARQWLEGSKLDPAAALKLLEGLAGQDLERVRAAVEGLRQFGKG
jgi:hypothetical protein